MQNAYCAASVLTQDNRQSLDAFMEKIESGDQKIYNSPICFVKKYFAAPTADASFLYEQFFKYETSCSKPLYAITFSPSGIKSADGI